MDLKMALYIASYDDVLKKCGKDLYKAQLLYFSSIIKPPITFDPIISFGFIMEAKLPGL